MDVHSYLPRKSHTQTKKAFFVTTQNSSPQETLNPFIENSGDMSVLSSVIRKYQKYNSTNSFTALASKSKETNNERHQASLHSGGFHSELYLPEMQAPSSLYHTYSFTFMQTFRNKSGMKNGDCMCSEFQSINITISYSVCGVYRVQSRYVSSLNHDKSSMR